MRRPGRFLPRTLFLLFLFVSLAGRAFAQDDPRVGYAYPAGAQRGTTVEIALGGQRLVGAKRVLISGAGVRAEVLEHVKPLSRKEMGELKQRLRMEERARRASDGDAGGATAPPAAEEESDSNLPDLTGMTEQELADLRRRLFDPKKQLNPQIAELVHLRVTVDPDAVPGRRELRVVARGGLSNPIRFQVGTRPEYREQEPNDRDAGQVPAAGPVVINGQVSPGDVDRFRFSARAGQELVAVGSARELVPYLADAVPGWFQAVLALYDADGRELAFADDFRFHPDPVLHCVIPADGDYVLEIRDSIYRGREDFVYRIELGELPFVTSIFPLGGAVGTRTEVEAVGWNLDETKLHLDDRDAGPGIRALDGRDGAQAAHPVPFAVDAQWDCLELEPNDVPESAQPLTVPMIVNGRIALPGDEDVYRITGHFGDEIVAEVRGRRLGSPIDSLLRLTDAEGKELAVNDDFEDRGAGLTTHHADSRLACTLPADGDYFLRLVDTQAQGSEAHAYRLHVRRRTPDFELRIVPSSLNLPAGGSLPVTVHALRRDGFEGDIALRLADPNRGFRLSGGWVPEGSDEILLTLTAPRQAPKQPVALGLEGRATIGEREVTRRAIPAEDMMQAFLYRHLVPMEQLFVLVRGGGNRSAAPFVLLGDTPVRLRAGGRTEVRVRGPREPREGTLELSLRGDPAGISIKRVSFPKGGAALVLLADPELVVGEKGNLIVDVVLVKTSAAVDGKPAKERRIPRGSLPAIPYELVRR